MVVAMEQQDSSSLGMDDMDHMDDMDDMDDMEVS